MKFLKKKNDLYLSGSKPGVLEGLAKIHNILEDETQSFCLILSTIGTPTLQPTTETTKNQQLHNKGLFFPLLKKF